MACLYILTLPLLASPFGDKSHLQGLTSFIVLRYFFGHCYGESFRYRRRVGER